MQAHRGHVQGQTLVLPQHDGPGPLVDDNPGRGIDLEGQRLHPRDELDQARLVGADVYHLAAVYDLEATEAENQRANVDGTRHAVELARQVGGRLHHVSSIAVAGSRGKGRFTEEMFEEGQVLDHPYYRTKYDAEKIVRESAVRFRIYRPGLVIGSSETGEADRIDGPYYAFKLIQRLRHAIPEWVPLIGFEGGEMNVVPVDFVARALDAIGHSEGLDGKTFHLTDPDGHALSFARPLRGADR